MNARRVGIGVMIWPVCDLSRFTDLTSPVKPWPMRGFPAMTRKTIWSAKSKY